jgi:hypothetical protein
MKDTKLTNVVRAYFGAYQAENRAIAESLLADDFSFTSPNDDQSGPPISSVLAHRDPSHDQRIEKSWWRATRPSSPTAVPRPGQDLPQHRILTFNGDASPAERYWRGLPGRRVCLALREQLSRLRSHQRDPVFSSQRRRGGGIGLAARRHLVLLHGGHASTLR